MYSFRSLAAYGTITSVYFVVFRSASPLWTIYRFGNGKPSDINLDDVATEFEIEVEERFQQSTSLRSVEFDFCRLED